MNGNSYTDNKCKLKFCSLFVFRQMKLIKKVKIYIFAAR